jgi:hypothetical protein
VIRAIPNVTLVEMEHHHEKAHCCASVLTILKEPPVAAKIGKDRLDEAREAGAGTVLSLCPCCQFQLRVAAEKKQVPVEVVDLAHFACRALGIESPDPNAEVKRQWAVFEPMVALMTPRGFADLMMSMPDELLRAAPPGMTAAMTAMANVPGGAALMKPLFPLLFPRLMPAMMPKLLPAILAQIAGRIPMPDYMAEQLPALMPKVVDATMPHMIGEVVPLISQPLIDHLRERGSPPPGPATERSGA